MDGLVCLDQLEWIFSCIGKEDFTFLNRKGSINLKHIYFYHKCKTNTPLLFECTTSDQVADIDVIWWCKVLDSIPGVAGLADSSNWQ